jgi:predicted acylesterase/phospholipase RssA
MGRELSRETSRRLRILGAAAFVATLVASSLFQGCAVRERPAVFDAPPRWYSSLNDDETMAKTLREAALAKKDGSLSVLCLTGGGANGAWGAGLICGWRKNPEKRPHFDVVGGVSTGALIATHAFLGEEADDLELARGYTTVKREDILEDRFLLALPFQSSFASTAPLESLIKKRVTDEAIRRVADEGKKGRLLIVGTVNLDVGALECWNMTEIAADGTPDRFDRFRRILLASSSFPVLMPPVTLGDYLHADGALRGRQFVQRMIEPIDKTLEAHTDLPRATIWVVVNGRPGMAVRFIRDRIFDVGARALNVMLDDNLVGAIETARRAARRGGVRICLSRIPENVPLELDPSAFDTEEMRALYERGCDAGSGKLESGGWEYYPPLEPPDTQASAPTSAPAVQPQK